MRFALFVLVACGKPAEAPLATCDHLSALLDRAAACSTLTPDARKTVDHAKAQLADVLKLVESSGAKPAPELPELPELIDALRETCAGQEASVTEALREAAPGCLP